MALHTGEIQGLPRGADPLLQQSERLLRACPPGQILCSEETAILLRRDLDPAARLVDLGLYRLEGSDRPERLFAVAPPGRPTEDLPRPSARSGYAGSLPLQLTRFFGRDAELAALQQLLRPDAAASGAARLVTLTGPGGTGKTRLAIETARALLEPFAGAVWFVPLAELYDPRRIVDALLQALHLPPSPLVEPIQQVVEALAQQPSLLVLDNFEQLLAGPRTAQEEGLAALRRLLEEAPSLVCLVTSRQRLGLSGEREFPLMPLPVPQETDTPERLSLNESAQLFSDRAQTVKPDFQVTRGNAAAVAALCERLEGIPLALELAAGRAQVLTPGQMLRQLERRFDFLVSRQRDVALRHQTLRGAIDWSYQMLSPELQRFFASLSVFRGGWNLAAAEQVTQNSEEVLDLLSQLRECSLVQAQDHPDEMRFTLLETLRAYAEEKLSAEERETLQSRHARYFLALAQEAAPALDGPRQGIWLDRLAAEQENLRAAFHWCQQDRERTEAGLRLAVALLRFWDMRGHFSEGRAFMQALLSQADTGPSTPPLAAAFNAAGFLAWRQGDYTVARTLHEQGLAHYQALGIKRGIAASLNNLGLVAESEGDYAAARTLYEEGLALQRELGNKHGIAVSLDNLGNVASSLGDYAAARALHEESLALRREIGDRFGIAASLGNLAVVVSRQGDHARGRALHEESLALFREIGDKRGIATELLSLAELAVDQEDFASAQALLEESLALFRQVGDKPGIAAALAGVAAVQIARQQPGRAVVLWAAAETLRESLGRRLPLAAREELEQYLNEARASLDPAAFELAWSQGRAMSWEHAVAYALGEKEES